VAFLRLLTPARVTNHLIVLVKPLATSSPNFFPYKDRRGRRVFFFLFLWPPSYRAFTG
jgi:hypothetical protein